MPLSNNYVLPNTPPSPTELWWNSLWLLNLLYSGVYPEFDTQPVNSVALAEDECLYSYWLLRLSTFICHFSFFFTFFFTFFPAFFPFDFLPSIFSSFLLFSLYSFRVFVFLPSPLAFSFSFPSFFLLYLLSFFFVTVPVCQIVNKISMLNVYIL